MDTPREIRRALARVAGRLRRVGMVGGVGVAVGVAAVALAIGMGADFGWDLPPMIRWGIWLASVGMAGLALVLGVIRPLVRSYDPVALAALAERSGAEGLVAAVELLGETGGRGSAAMVAAGASRAADRVREIDPARAVPARRAVRSLAIGMGMAGLVAFPIVARPDPFARVARRAVAPWIAADRVGRFALVVEPGDATVALGSDFAVNARVAPRIAFAEAPPEAASLVWTDTTGTERRLRMATTAGPDGTRAFAARVPRLEGSIRYRVEAGRAGSSRRYEVEAVAPPGLASIAVNVEPPAYTKLPAGPAADPAKLDVVEGSALAFRLVADRPVAGFAVSWPGVGGERTVEAPAGADGRTAAIRVEAPPPGSHRFEVRPVRDKRLGLDGPREPRRIVVRPDAPPTVVVPRLAGPGGSDPVDAPADDTIALAMAARDDFAVASVEVHYEIRRMGSTATEAGHVVAPIAGLDSPRAAGEAVLGLRPLGLRGGDAVEYRVRVADNRPGPAGPNVTWSGRGTVRVVAGAEPMVARAERLRLDRAKDRVEAIAREVAANRREAGELRGTAESARSDPKAWNPARARALADREAAAAAIEASLAGLADDFEADPTAAALGRLARGASEVEARSSRQALAGATRAADANARVAGLRSAESRLAAVGHRVEELKRGLDDLAKRDETRRALRDLADREDALADRAGTDPATLRAEQDRLRAELDALAAKDSALRSGQLAAQAAEAEALAAKARALADRQRDEARRLAADDPDNAADPARAALAEEQRKIEADARRLAADVDEPLAEAERSRLDAKALAEAVAAVDARGQAGSDPARDRARLEAAEAALRRLARDLDDAPADPRAFARRLARRQESIARTLDGATADLPDKPDAEARVESARPALAGQEALLAQARSLKVDGPHQGQVNDAIAAVDRAIAPLREGKAREARPRLDEARNALNRLADALPPPWNRDEPARQAVEEARRSAEETAREVERHVRETEAQARGDRPRDDAGAAVDLARRLEPIAARQAALAAKLAAIDLPARFDPARESAARRATALGTLTEAARAAAKPLADAPKPGAVPIRDWQVAGPFRKAEPPPFPLDRPVDPAGKLKGKASEVGWKPFHSDDPRGRVDLGAAVSRDADQSAYAVADLVAPTAGPARFAVGSDDTMVVWVDGKQVYKFDGDRGYSPEAATLTVDLAAGPHRVVVRCGNVNSDWAFGVEATFPPPLAPEIARAEVFRRALPQAAAEAKAAVDRLAEALRGQAPADEVAREVAAEAESLAQQPDEPNTRPARAAESRRIAAALRGLAVPDAEVPRAEAARLAEAAAGTKPEANLSAALDRSAKAARALADRLADRVSPRAEAQALAEAERAEPPAVDDPEARARRLRELAAVAARIEASSPPGPDSKATPTAGEATARAARVAEAVARANGSDPDADPAGLDPARKLAADRLDSLAARLPDAVPNPTDRPAPSRPLPDAPADPGGEVEGLKGRSAEAKALATRQRRVREGIEAIEAGRSAPQEGIRREAIALGKEFAGLRDRSRETGPSGRGAADAAAEQVGRQAPGAMARGIEAATRGRADAAREERRQAAEHVERAAGSADDLARALRRDRAQARGDDPANASGRGNAPDADLGPARAALDAARRGLSPGELHAAAGAIRSLARSGQAPGPGMGPDPSESSDPDPISAPAGSTPADLAALRATVRESTGRDWGQLPGHLRTEILRRSRTEAYRDDYARLIGLYFREIAATPPTPDRP